MTMAARVRREGESPSHVSPEEVRRTLDRILASKYFVHAPMKRKFLRLVCDFYLNGRAGELNEYRIGREVFERDDSYNPGADPIVRVGAHDLRKKLQLYYESEGASDDIRLEIPVGGYEPLFVRRRSEPTETPESSRPAAVRRTLAKQSAFNRPVVALGLLSVSLLAAVVVLWSSNRELRRHVAEKTPAVDEVNYGMVWEPFFKPGAQTLVIMTNPSVYRLSNPIDSFESLEGRVALSDQESSVLAKMLKDEPAAKKRRALRLVLSSGDYTRIGEAIGLFRITDLFRSTGRSIVFKHGRTAGADDLKNHNVILLGGGTLNGWPDDLAAAREDFNLAANSTIENRLPLTSEVAEYQPEFDEKTGKLRVDYGLITVKPNISVEYTAMVLAGIHSEGTAAAAEYVTTRNYIDDLNERLRQLGGDSTPPRYYQALLKVAVENGAPATISVVALHELRAGQE